MCVYVRRRVLESINFDTVFIRMIVVEVMNVPLSSSSRDLENETVAAANSGDRYNAVRNFLAARGYKKLGLSFRLGDHVFVRLDDKRFKAQHNSLHRPQHISLFGALTTDPKLLWSKLWRYAMG